MKKRTVAVAAVVSSVVAGTLYLATNISQAQESPATGSRAIGVTSLDYSVRTSPPLELATEQGSTIVSGSFGYVVNKLGSSIGRVRLKVVLPASLELVDSAGSCAVTGRQKICRFILGEVSSVVAGSIEVRGDAAQVQADLRVVKPSLTVTVDGFPDGDDNVANSTADIPVTFV